MAGQKFSILENHTLDNSNVDGNGKHHLYISPSQNNQSGPNGYLFDSLRVVIQYGDPVPNGAYTSEIRAIVESSNGETGANELWFPIAYQFEGFYVPDGGPTREIMLHPALTVVDMGVDDIVWDGGFAAAISRQQGKLGADFRVCIIMNETAYGTSNAFQSVPVSIYGEMFNAND